MPSTVNDTLMMPLGLGLQKGKKNKKREKRKEKKEKRLGDEAIGASLQNISDEEMMSEGGNHPSNDRARDLPDL